MTYYITSYNIINIVMYNIKKLKYSGIFKKIRKLFFFNCSLPPPAGHILIIVIHILKAYYLSFQNMYFDALTQSEYVLGRAYAMSRKLRISYLKVRIGYF